MDSDNPDKEEYLHKDLTQKIIGALYNVYNGLGFGYREKEYQKAFAEELKKIGLTYTRELYCKLLYNEKPISVFYIDFLIEDKVIVELKVADDFYKKHFDQVMTYLKTNGLQVGLLSIFTSQKVLIKRIINQTSA